VDHQLRVGSIASEHRRDRRAWIEVPGRDWSPEALGQRRLRIDIKEEHSPTHLGKRARKMVASRAFPDASLLIQNRHDGHFFLHPKSSGARRTNPFLDRPGARRTNKIFEKVGLISVSGAAGQGRAPRPRANRPLSHQVAHDRPFGQHGQSRRERFDRLTDK
jgi:hypothetical protein